MTALRLPSLRWLPLLGVAALVLAVFGWSERGGRVAARPDAADHNYNLQVRGFQAGQLNLKLATPAGLAELADPLDPAANEKYRSPPYWLHDLSFYRGRLYFYFGVSPAILLFWPWAVVTGHYLSHSAAVASFSAVIFLTAGGLLLGVWRRFFPTIGTGVATAGLALVGLATGLPIMLQRPEFYEVAVTCGGALTLLALAGVCLAQGLARRRAWPLAVASLAYGLAIGARPSLLFGSVILLLPVIRAWRERGAAASRAEPWKLLAAAILPLLLCGVGLALYNELRFGRATEFGQTFQMAGDRQDTARHFSASYLWYNLRVYFLAPAHWIRTFPFVQPIAAAEPPAGHADVDGAFGILPNLPVLCFALAAPLAWRGRAAGEQSFLRGLVIAATLLFLGCAMPVCLFYGSCWRYEMDFMPALMVLAGVGILGVERCAADRRLLRLAVRTAWGGLLLVSLGFNFLESVSCHADTIESLALRQVEAGNLSAGIAYHRQVLRLSPAWSEAHDNLGLALVKVPGGEKEAVAQFQQAIRLDPLADAPHYHLGNVWSKRPEHLLEAINEYQEALRLYPPNENAEVQLGAALARVPGRLEEAVGHFQRALAIDSDCFNAHNDLAVALTHLPGRMADAIGEFEAAAQIKPGDPLIAKNLARALRQSQP